MTASKTSRPPTVDAKRLVDVVVAGTGLAVLSPVLLIVALGVRLGSRGPIIFRQERVGRDGLPFRIHKFRTLRTGLGGPLISATHDPRATRVGVVLRRTKLDELPQLLDVLVGDMSLVGPRPEVPRYVARWPIEARETILSVRPGITDPASIALRNESDELASAADPEDYYVTTLLPRKVVMYVDYVTSRTLVGDLRILVATVGAVLRE